MKEKVVRLTILREGFTRLTSDKMRCVGVPNQPLTSRQLMAVAAPDADESDLTPEITLEDSFRTTN